MKLARISLLLLGLAMTSVAQTSRSVHLVKIEAIQSVQDLAGTVPLIAGKQTVVRAYVTGDMSSMIKRLTGELKIAVSGKELILRSPLPVTLVALESYDIRGSREHLEASLNFVLPQEATQGGVATIQTLSLVNADDLSAGEVDCDGCGVALPLTFVEEPPLRLRLVGIRYTSNGGPVANQPRQLDFELIRSWLERVYPVGKVEVSSCLADTDESYPFDCTTANAIVANVRAKELASSLVGNHAPGLQPCGSSGPANAELSRTHYYGVVSDGGGFMRGCASVIADQPDFTGVASGPTGDPSRWSNFAWDNDGSYGDWYAGHELGHLLGRRHPGKCGSTADDNKYPYATGRISDTDGGSVGFDVGYPARNIPMSVLPGTMWSDTMDYCDHVWQSGYTFKAIRERIGSDQVSNAGPTPDQSQENSEVRNGDFLNIIATVDVSNAQGKLKYINHLTRGTITRTANHPEISIRMLNSSSQMIAEIPVDVQFSVPSGANRRGLINLTTAFDRNTHEIQLLIGSRIVDQRKIGTATPTVNTVSAQVKSGPQDGHLGPVSVQGARIILKWDATDTDRDRLTYGVDVSKDSGVTWTTLASDLSNKQLILNPSTVDLTKSMLFRIRATDGIQEGISEPQALPINKETEDLLAHVQWSIFHEGCDVYHVPAGKKPLDDVMRPVSELRLCYMRTHAHDAQAQGLIGSTSDNSLQTAIEVAAREIPARFELFVNFEWVARHEGKLSTFVQLKNVGAYDQIRQIYRAIQAHNPNAVNLLSAVSNRSIRSMLDTLSGIDQKKPQHLDAIE